MSAEIMSSFIVRDYTFLRIELYEFSNIETLNHTLSKDIENSPEVYKSELWRPLNCLVEAANRTKGLNS
ncbi:hypothetical protein KSP40_PGU021363 [Platanthera guangdongensis]|uniref:Uncharacterized protein n=1 Tax=Platanthera guangdongensis TaxID=2320717 RepID=A0ABR2MGI8_9ASPA